MTKRNPTRLTVRTLDTAALEVAAGGYTLSPNLTITGYYNPQLATLSNLSKPANETTDGSTDNTK